MFATTLKRIVAASIVTGSLSLVPAHAGAADQAMLINPSASNSYVCTTDEGYGRRNFCDRGGA
jgi:hypothetical protein